MEFSAGQAFSDAFKRLGGRFGLLFAMWLLFFVVTVAMFVAFGGAAAAMLARSTLAADAPSQVDLATSSRLGAGLGVTVVLLYLVYFLILFAQQIALSRVSTGREEDSFGVALGAGLRGTPTMFGVALIYLLGFVVLSALSRALSGESALGVVLSLLMLIGMLYLFARLSLVLPLIAIEEMRNPFNAIAKAWRLAAGHSLKLTGLWAAVLIAAFALLFGAIAASTGFRVGAAGPMASVALLIAVMLWWITVGLYMVTLTTALYDQLSPSSVEETADTFA